MAAVIFRKELHTLFYSPLAWLLLALIQLVLSWFFLLQLDAFLELQPQLRQLSNSPGVTETIITPLFAIAVIIFLMVTPVLSMRLLAEERRNHTLVLLISAPIPITDIVLGKFAALLSFYSITVVLMVVLSLSLLAGGKLDYGLLWSNVVGLILIAACFSAVGLYISSLTAQPALAAVGCLSVLLGLWVIDWFGDAAGPVRFLSLLQQFRQFNQGLLDTFSLSYCILFVITFLILTVCRLDSERLYG
ncbi:MAG: ABC transporter permease [Nitrosomonas sp.]|nr:MAG: ABC transporter permease [Nitrosomonas sp.]